MKSILVFIIVCTSAIYLSAQKINTKSKKLQPKEKKVEIQNKNTNSNEINVAPNEVIPKPIQVKEVTNNIKEDVKPVKDTMIEKWQTIDNLGERAKNESQLLEQFSMGYSGVSPKVNLQTYKYSALVGNGYWDFYLHNSVPTINPNPNDSIKYVTSDIMQHIGGLLNVELGKIGYFGYGKDPSLKNIKGIQVDFRIGGRMIDVPNRRTGAYQFIPSMQSSLDLRYLIPLFNSKKYVETGEKKPIQDRYVGNLTFRFQGSTRYIFKSDTYDRYFETARGNKPNHLMFLGSAELYFFITNKIYLSAGYIFNNIPTVPSLPFFSVSYGSN